MPLTVAEAPSAGPLILPDNQVVEVNDLSVRFTTSERTVDAVRHLSFHVDRGETLAIVGESGSGKSVTSLALMRLVEHGGGRITTGSMMFRRRSNEVLDLAQARDPAMRSIRGADIAMIFQEPMTSLNPVFTAGDQIAESIQVHQGKSAAAARAEALRMLELVRIPEARNVLNSFPYQLSGSQRQRVLLQVAAAVAEYFKRRQLIPHQVIERELDGGDMLVSTSVAHADEVLPIVRYWLPHIQVLEPLAFQQQLEAGLREYLAAMAAKPQ